MPDLLIFGTGPHAVEMLTIIDRINHMGSTWNVLGFVSPREDMLGQHLAGLQILGAKVALEVYPDAFIIPDYEWPRKADLPRQRLTSLIDPTTFICQTAQVGLGCVIYPHSFVGSNARIGDFVFCLAGTVINHNDIIDEGVTLTSGVVLAGDVHVEAGCYLGQACTVREMVTVGRGSLIGMGSVVIQHVEPNSVVVGNPGRRLRSRERNYPGAPFVKSAGRLARKGARAARQQVLSAWARYVRLDEAGS